MILTPEECEVLKDTTQSLTPATTTSGGESYVSNYRIAEVCKYVEDTPLTLKIREALANYDNKPITYIEPVQIVKYPVGGVFKTHQDGEWRKTTLIINLNEDYTGGELFFKKTNKKMKLCQGEGIFFSSNLFHECLPILSGEKWIAVCWSNYNEVP